MIVTVPLRPEFGVKVTEQLATPSDFCARGQLAAGVKVPEEAGFWVSVMVPRGVTAVGGELSETVMTQVVGVFGMADEGVQTTPVEVERCVGTIVPWPVLGRWFVSPR